MEKTVDKNFPIFNTCHISVSNLKSNTMFKDDQYYHLLLHQNWTVKRLFIFLLGWFNWQLQLSRIIGWSRMFTWSSFVSIPIHNTTLQIALQYIFWFSCFYCTWKFCSWIERRKRFLWSTWWLSRIQKCRSLIL